MGQGDKIPNVWDDDDWEVQADRAAKEESSKPEPEVPLTHAERLMKHAEEQRKLWESAEAPEEVPFFLPTTNQVPLATPFKPAVKVLSRKPAPQKIVKRDPVTGLEQLTIQDDNEEDEAGNKKQESAEEIRKRQQRELEEKQRRYEEARAKIFGDSNPSSGQSTPRTGTPPSGRPGGSQATSKPAAA
ncbi:c293a1be-b978-4bb5-8e01-ee11e9cf0697 [Thermothielavioides terrestris]|uniref:C293a1be-b978-4bb5-8e01-ee11e9cf0697 n=1 Tax=Thermothielavioides terrestris TaxID=2587410 RepID=A0A3S4B0K7_9PEZI|nr:c293a1be-b978-4bb5-8e01-ee11e9cf0697 [Thermothielavioides terrestris]